MDEPCGVGRTEDHLKYFGGSQASSNSENTSIWYNLAPCLSHHTAFQSQFHFKLGKRLFFLHGGFSKKGDKHDCTDIRLWNLCYLTCFEILQNNDP